MLAEEEHGDHSLRKYKVTDIKGVRQTDLWERTSYCSDLLNTDSLSPQQPSPLTELNYSTAHNITSFIRELNVPPHWKWDTHTPSWDAHALMPHIIMHWQCKTHTRCKILAGIHMQALTLIHPQP